MLEQNIIHSEEPKEIMKKLETKIARQIRIDKVLKLIVLFSLTQSGLKKDDLEHIRRLIGMNYNHSEVATLCNL